MSTGGFTVILHKNGRAINVKTTSCLKRLCKETTNIIISSQTRSIDKPSKLIISANYNIIRQSSLIADKQKGPFQTHYRRPNFLKQTPIPWISKNPEKFCVHLSSVLRFIIHYSIGDKQCEVTVSYLE